MSAAKGTRSSYLGHLPALSGLGVLLLLAAVTMTTAASGRLQASTKADFSLAPSPTSATLQQGQTATYTITETKLNGFASPVALSAGNVPTGAATSFSPQTLDTKSTSTLTVTTGTSTPTGSYSITVTGTGGGVTHQLAVQLVVSSGSTFSLAATPSSATVAPGGTASYAVTPGTTNGFTGTVALSVTGAPAGSTSTFAPASVSMGSSSTLQVATKNNTGTGTYTLTITGTSGTKQASTTVTLVVAVPSKAFSITSPNVVVPGPGAGVGMNLSITNPNNQAVQITNLTVGISSVTKSTTAPADRPCSAADYTITQVPGSSYPIPVQAGQTIDLSHLGVANTAWPQLRMLNTSSNQDGCKGATLSLTFSGTGQG